MRVVEGVMRYYRQVRRGVKVVSLTSPLHLEEQQLSAATQRRPKQRIELITWTRTECWQNLGTADQDCQRYILRGAGILFVLHHVSQL
jgi:hypothetical protein